MTWLSCGTRLALQLDLGMTSGLYSLFLLCSTASALIVGLSPTVVPTLCLSSQAIGELLLIWMVGWITSLLLLFYYEVKNYKSQASKICTGR